MSTVRKAREEEARRRAGDVAKAGAAKTDTAKTEVGTDEAAAIAAAFAEDADTMAKSTTTTTTPLPSRPPPPYSVIAPTSAAAADAAAAAAEEEEEEEEEEEQPPRLPILMTVVDDGSGARGTTVSTLTWFHLNHSSEVVPAMIRFHRLGYRVFFGEINHDLDRKSVEIDAIFDAIAAASAQIKARVRGETVTSKKVPLEEIISDFGTKEIATLVAESVDDSKPPVTTIKSKNQKHTLTQVAYRHVTPDRVFARVVWTHVRPE